MFYIISFGIGALLIIAFLRFLFSPYFAWKSSLKMSRSLKEKDNVQVMYKGRSYIFSDFPQDLKEQVDLSIVIPAYNEESRLANTLSKTIEFFSHLKLEIIVINDASKDKTKEVALSFQQYAGSEVDLKIINYTVNRGKGGAVRIGMLFASGEKILMMDADLATDLNDYENVDQQLTRIQKNGLGIITGCRNHMVKSVETRRKPLRKFVSLISNFITNVICGVNLKDTQCGFKLFTKDTAKKIFRIQHLERWAFDVEVFMIAKHIKAPFAEVPVNWHDVEGSHLNVITASITMARDFLLVRVLYLIGLWTYKDDIGL